MVSPHFSFDLNDPDLVEDTQPPPAVLYHYTDVKGFFDIVNAGSRLHATHHRFLNDAGEVEFGFEVATNFFHGLANDLGTDVIKLVDLEISKVLYGESFIACLSAKYDVLSQWRAYANSGAGYCIGFRAQNRLSGYGEGDDFRSNRLLECIYGRQALEARLNLRFPREHARVARQAFQDQEELLAAHLAQAAWRYAHLAKHEHFREEHEWRFIVGAPRHDIQYRVGRLGLTPYLPTETMEIVEVWIGPRIGPEPEIAKVTAAHFLSQHGIASSVDYWASPFRG
jgi:hypothetical protein